MEDEFVGYYLGSSMLTKGTTGLGVIQKPLREKYFAFRKSAENRLGPEVGIRVNPSGIVLMFPGGRQTNDDFYDISSIHFIEAVQFAVLKQKDKKFVGAFVPIDENKAKNTNQDKLFVSIEKKFLHLTKISHPPMLACVMRRPTGVKAVDLHMFLIPEVNDALHIADLVQRFQHRPGPQDYFDPPGPRPPPGRHDNVYPNPDILPREFGSRGVGKRDSGENYELYRGRGVELRQDHFRRRSPEYHDRPLPEDRAFPPNRSFERNSGKDRDRFDQEPDRGPYGSGRGETERDPLSERRNREYRSGGRFVERDSIGREYEFDNQVVHNRHSSGGDVDLGRYDQHPGGMSPRSPNYNGNPPFRRDGDRSPDRGRDQNRYGRGPFEEPYNQRNSGDNPRYQRPGQNQRGRSPQRALSPQRRPLSPHPRSPDTPDETVYSFSNLESRQDAEPHGKPVAKVPPHRHAGIRVLPSLPIPGAKNQLKPVSPRSPETTRNDEKPPTYNFDEQNDSYDENNKMIPYGDFRKDRSVSDSSYIERRNDGLGSRGNDGGRVKSDSFNYMAPQINHDRYGFDNNFKSSEGHNKPTEPWSYDDEKEKFLRLGKPNSGMPKGYESKSDFRNQSYGSGTSEDGQSDSKDAEIANMFSYLNTESSGREDDFEQSLGYLP